MPKLRRPVDPRQKNQHAVISFTEQPCVEAFVKSIGYSLDAKDPNEVCCFGTRGDGKTIGFMVGAIEHARQHFKAGYPLPVQWMGVTDTFTSHKLKTVRSLENPLWKGGWKLSDQDHKATFYLAGSPLVSVDLFGIEDQGAMDRVRMETVGMWFEEPAPSAVMVQSSGVSLDAWLLGRTSQRLPSQFHPAVITTNYPDEDHWTWERFVVSQHEGTRYFRVPPGERASESQREEWRKALSARPDLLRRLLDGEPGVIMLGDQVAKGFTRPDHVSRETHPFMPGEPVYMGFDFGHTPTCVISQPMYLNGFQTLIFKAGLHINGGMRQLMDDMVLPWLGRFAPWVLKNADEYALIGHDPAQGDIGDPKGTEADIDNTALTVIQEALGGGQFEMGPIKWEIRKDALVSIFMRAHGCLIEDNRFTKDLIRSLDGRWYYPKSHQNELRSDKPKKPNHPFEDLGDAFIYNLCRYGAIGLNEKQGRPLKVLTNVPHQEYRDNQTPQDVVSLTNWRY